MSWLQSVLITGDVLTSKCPDYRQCPDFKVSQLQAVSWLQNVLITGDKVSWWQAVSWLQSVLTTGDKVSWLQAMSWLQSVLITGDKVSWLQAVSWLQSVLITGNVLTSKCHNYRQCPDFKVSWLQVIKCPDDRQCPDFKASDKIILIHSLKATTSYTRLSQWSIEHPLILASYAWVPICLWDVEWLKEALKSVTRNLRELLRHFHVSITDRPTAMLTVRGGNLRLVIHNSGKQREMCAYVVVMKQSFIMKKSIYMQSFRIMKQ